MDRLTPIWLSHPLSVETPVYGGGKGLKIEPTSCIASGDAANTACWTFPNHFGTHVDTPLHFFDEGKTVTDYTASFWIFYHPQLIDVPGSDGYLIVPEDVIDKILHKTDLLLLRSGYEEYRKEKRYWQKNPGLSKELAQMLRTDHPHIRAVGVDTISITSRLHREEGRDAHREFLGSSYDSEPIVLIEDMSLINYKEDIKQVIISPLMIENADGAPCTVIAF